jgi:outer membrane immunogenic protein
MKKLIVGVAAALTFTTGNAIADGPYRRPAPTIAAPVPEPPPSWTGFYLGAGIGVGVVMHDFDVNKFNHYYDRWDRFDRDRWDDNVFGTVIAGWDWQHSHTVFGVFADYDFSDHSSSFDDGWFRRSLSLDNVWSVGARLGWLSNSATLWYLTGGYTEAEVSDSARWLSSGKRAFSEDTRLSGYFVGAGVDTRLHSNWFLRLEYRFTEFDDEEFKFAENPYVKHDLDTSIHSARLTLTYKFGHGYGWGGWGKWW